MVAQALRLQFVTFTDSEGATSLGQASESAKACLHILSKASVYLACGEIQGILLFCTACHFGFS